MKDAVLLVHCTNDELEAYIAIRIPDVPRFVLELQLATNLADTCRRACAGVRSLDLEVFASASDVEWADHAGGSLLGQLRDEKVMLIREAALWTRDEIGCGRAVLRVFPDDEVEVACTLGEGETWVDSIRFDLLNLLKEKRQ